MAIPGFQSIFLPLLKFAADGHEHNVRDARQKIAMEFKLSEEELKQLLNSGKQTVFSNRVGWAKVYLTKAGLIEPTKKGCFRITKRGKEVLEENPEKLNVRYLKKYPEFEKFHKPSPKPAIESGEFEPSPDTPVEALERAYKNLRDELAEELYQQIMGNSADFFERLVVQLIVKLGYGGSIKDAGQAVGKSGDEGIDGIIKEDKLGLDIIYIQAKKWGNTIQRPEIQKFAGALQGQRAQKGIFITTSSFSSGAIEFVTKIDTKVVLIDGEQLVDLMIDNNLGVSITDSYEVKKVDTDFFTED